MYSTKVTEFVRAKEVSRTASFTYKLHDPEPDHLICHKVSLSGTLLPPSILRQLRFHLTLEFGQLAIFDMFHFSRVMEAVEFLQHFIDSRRSLEVLLEVFEGYLHPIEISVHEICGSRHSGCMRRLVLVVSAGREGLGNSS